MKTYDVVALGELLIDFTESGLSPQGNPLWEANPGGAPCNVLAMLNKLDRRTAFIGKAHGPGGPHHLGHRPYLPQRGQGFLLLSQSRRRYDAAG